MTVLSFSPAFFDLTLSLWSFASKDGDAKTINTYSEHSVTA